MAVALNMLSSCVCVTCNFDKICFFAPADDSSNKIFILEATHITPDSTASNDYVPVRNHKVHGRIPMFQLNEGLLAFMRIGSGWRRESTDLGTSSGPNMAIQKSGALVVSC
jgi:hypothetical protein